MFLLNIDEWHSCVLSMICATRKLTFLIELAWVFLLFQVHGRITYILSWPLLCTCANCICDLAYWSELTGDLLLFSIVNRITEVSRNDIYFFLMSYIWDHLTYCIPVHECVSLDNVVKIDSMSLFMMICMHAHVHYLFCQTSLR